MDLHSYRARYYHPGLQRFISEDPIGFEGGINVYAYVVNDPMSFSDPLGLDKNSRSEQDETCGLGLPSLPPGESLDRNIALARWHKLRFYDPVGAAISVGWWANKVRPGGQWDYKLRPPIRRGLGSPFENGGNYNYGATGSALGIPLPVLRRAAGFVQWVKGPYDPANGTPWGASPYGDEPRDQVMIDAGMDYTTRCAR